MLYVRVIRPAHFILGYAYVLDYQSTWSCFITADENSGQFVQQNNLGTKKGVLDCFGVGTTSI